MKAIGRIIGLALLSGITITTYGKESGKMTDMKNPGVRDEKLQLTGQGRLRDMHAVCRRRDAACPRHAQKVFQHPEFHLVSFSVDGIIYCFQ